MSLIFELLNNNLPKQHSERVLFFLRAQLLTIKKNPSYIPISEIELLLTLLEQYPDNPTFLLLIEYSNLVYKRSPKTSSWLAPRLKKVIRLQGSRPNKAVHLFLSKHAELAKLLCTRETDKKDTLIPSMSVCLNGHELINAYDFILQAQTLNKRFTYSVFHRPDLAEALQQLSAPPQTFEILLKIYKYIWPSLLESEVTDEFLITLFEHSNNIDLTLIVQEILATASNKEQILIRLLNAFFTVYQNVNETGQVDILEALLRILPTLIEEASFYVNSQKIASLLKDIRFDRLSPHYPELDALFNEVTKFIVAIHSKHPVSMLSLQILLAESMLHDGDTTIPPLLRAYLNDYSLTTQRKFIAFYQKLAPINQRAPSFQQRNPYELILSHQIKIMMVFEIFCESTCQLLTEQLAGTLLSLERFLSQLPTLPTQVVNNFKVFVSARYQDQISSAQEIQQILDAMTIIASLVKQTPELLTRIGDILIRCQQQQSVEEIQSVTEAILIELLLELKRLKPTALLSTLSPNKLLEQFSIDDIVHLFIATENIEDDDYEEAFYLLLSSKLRNIPFNALLEQTDSDMARGILRHNRQIADKIAGYDVSPEQALHYDKPKHHLYIAGNQVATVKQCNRWRKLYPLLITLQKKINELGLLNEKDLPLKQKQQLQAVIKNIHTLNALKAKSEQDSTFFFDAVTKNLVKKIYRNIKALTASENSNFNVIMPLLDSMLRQLSGIDMDYKPPKKTKKVKDAYAFKVEQWDKSHPLTFRLGDWVNCCLATDGAASNAMTQRQLDDAWLFFTITDCKSKNVAGLVWAYLAETTSGTLTLVINFFEANSRYSHDKALRGVIRNLLIDYCRQYTQDALHHDEFYMAFLSYGPFSRDLRYPYAGVNFKDKLGGAPNPTTNFTTSTACKEDTCKYYYLASLEYDEVDGKMFYRFDEAQLKRDHIDGQYTLDELVSHEMQTAITEKLSFDTFKENFSADFEAELYALFANEVAVNGYLNLFKEAYREALTATTPRAALTTTHHSVLFKSGKETKPAGLVVASQKADLYSSAAPSLKTNPLV